MKGEPASGVLGAGQRGLVHDPLPLSGGHLAATELRLGFTCSGDRSGPAAAGG